MRQRNAFHQKTTVAQNVASILALAIVTKIPLGDQTMVFAILG